MAEVVFRPEAERDLEDIGFYHADHAGAANRLIHRILRTCDRLATAPHLRRSRSHYTPGLRSFAVRPFIVFYRPLEHGVEVVRILHGMRNLDAILSSGESDSL